MSRIQACLQGLKDKGRKALIPYITAGDPVPGVTVGLMHALVDAGADIVELGVPFSDGRWPGDPAGLRACAEPWHSAG